MATINNSSIIADENPAKMSKERLKEFQQELLELGLYDGLIDGIYGSKTHKAVTALNALKAKVCACPDRLTPTTRKIAWGSKVSPAFRDRVMWIATELQLPPNDGANWLMACMAWESGESFSPSVKNMAGSGAIGLIQFMPSTAKALGTTTAKLGQMTAENQLNYVYKYLFQYKGRIKTLSDLYMTILWPIAVGKPENQTLWTKDKQPTTYRQNAGLDTDKNLTITKAEAAAHVQAKLIKGLQFLG